MMSRVQRGRAGDADALALAAGELVRKLFICARLSPTRSNSAATRSRLSGARPCREL
jgi:hypothetical protein